MKIINFGSLNIDNSYYVTRFVNPGETMTIKSLVINPGGKGLNQSIAVSKAGSKIYHAGIYGDGGELLFDYLKDNNVNVDYLTKKEIVQGHAVIQINEEGENCIILFEGSNHSLDKEFVQRIIEDFDKGDYLLIQNEVNCLNEIIDKANEKKMTTIFNPAPISENIKSIDFNKIDWLIINEIEGHGLSGELEPRAIIENLSARYTKLNILLTLGAKGSICKIDQDIYYQEAYLTDVIDTTGAGDTFIGYFVSGLSMKLPISDNLKRASMAASISVSKKGGAPSIPKYEDVNIMLDE